MGGVPEKSEAGPIPVASSQGFFISAATWVVPRESPLVPTDGGDFNLNPTMDDGPRTILHGQSSTVYGHDQPTKLRSSSYVTRSNHSPNHHPRSLGRPRNPRQPVS